MLGRRRRLCDRHILEPERDGASSWASHELPPLLALATEGAMRVAAILKDTINSHMLQILDARAEADAKAAASNQDANDDQ